MEGLQRNKVTQVAQVLQVRNVRSQKGEGSSLVLNLEFTQVPVKDLAVYDLNCMSWCLMFRNFSAANGIFWCFHVFPILLL